MNAVCSFMNSLQDDVRLPFSVLDPIVGDVWSVLWEPDMIRETGDALKILTAEVLSQVGQTVLQTTVMATLMTALQWPISKLDSEELALCLCLHDSFSFDEVRVPD
jgi:hypothetical protein